MTGTFCCSIQFSNSRIIRRRASYSQTRIRDLAARWARGLHYLPPKEGVGNAGCPLHPRSRVHFVLVERTRVTTSTPEHPAFPHAMVLTAYVVLSPVTGLFCHRRQRISFCHCPVGPIKHPQNLTPASGRQDHTILPSAASVSRQRAGDRSQVFRLALRSHRAQNAAASTASHSYVRDDRDTPLLWGGMARICRDDLPDG
jgi:hypothetical protein